MPYQVEWITKNIIMRVTLYGELSMDDIERAFGELSSLVDSSERHLVHVLMDTTEIEQHPILLGPLTSAARPLFGHERMGWTLVYGLRLDTMRYVLQMLARIFENRFRILDSAQEALNFLHHVDPLLEQDMGSDAAL